MVEDCTSGDSVSHLPHHHTTHILISARAGMYDILVPYTYVPPHNLPHTIPYYTTYVRMDNYESSKLVIDLMYYLTQHHQI